MRGGRIFIIIGIVLFVIVSIGALAYFAIGGPQPAPTPVPEDVTPTEEPSPKVEIVELPESASLGDSFCHSGTRWKVMATRTGDRVLIARPISA